MPVRASDIARMEAKDLSRWAPKSKPKRKATEVFIDPDKDDINRRGAEVLHELTNRESAEDRLIDDAYKVLNERYAVMEEAGLPKSMAAQMDGMGAITKNVPQEVRVRETPRVETRYHTRYGEENPITGQRDIDPFIDPVTGKGMVTQLGSGVRDMDGYEKASEYVQQQLGRLAGMKIVPNHGSNRYATDFVDRGIKIDGETTRPSWREDGDAVQAYTKVVDADNPNAPANRMAPEIKRLMQGIIAKNPDANIQEVMDIAGNRLDGGTNRYGNVVDPLLGKVFDKDKDAVLLTVLSDKDHQMNKNNYDSTPVPVQAALYQDLNGMRQVIDDLSGKELSRGLQVRPNYGNNRDGEARGRVYVTPSEQTAQQYTVDLAQTFPSVRQLFDYRQ